MKINIILISFFILTACSTFPTQTPTITPPLSDSTTTITGTITAVNDACSYDGICSFKVNQTWVEIFRGGILPPNLPEEIKGQIIGDLPFNDSSKGLNVEVHGQRSPEGGLTIYGNANYYIKRLNN